VDFQGRASFLAVYITEAHARDEWPVGQNVSFCNQPKTLDQRLSLANRLTTELDCPAHVVVDKMDDEFMKTFAAWPFRYYIVHKGKIALKAQPAVSSYGYTFERDLREWLDQHTDSRTASVM